MPYSLIESFLSSSPENTAGRWSGEDINSLANEMDKLQHKWVEEIVNQPNMDPDHAQAALDLTNYDYNRVGNTFTIEPIVNFMTQSPSIAADRWANRSTITELANEMKKLQHNWTADVLATTTVTASKAKSALDGAFIAGNQSDDDEFQDILQIQPLAYLLNLINLTLSDTTISSNTTISGFNAYQNLTIDPGNTLILDGQPALLLVSGTLENNGTIEKTATGATGGAGGDDSSGDGGTGAGGAYLLTNILKNNGLISLNGTNGSDGSVPSSDGAGANGNSGLEITIGGTSYLGTGGIGGNTQDATGDNFAPGSGANQSTSNMTISQIVDHIRNVLVDLWLQNIESRNPSIITSPKDIKGNGGGGGDAEYDVAGPSFCAGGGGGGSGGQLLTYCQELDNQGTIESVGGNSGSVYLDNGGVVSGAVDGGNGHIAIAYKVLTNQGTLTAGGSTLIDTS